MEETFYEDDGITLRNKIRKKEELKETYFSTDNQYNLLESEISDLKKQLNYLVRTEYSETIYEMATLYVDNQRYSIMLAVNPDVNRQGDWYFKMYKGTSITNAEYVARIRFDRPEFIKKHKGRIKAVVSIGRKEKNELVEMLNEKSHDYPKYTNYEVLKFSWNRENGFAVATIDKYENGEYDEIYSEVDENGKQKYPNYIPSTLKQPDYKLL